MNTNATDTPRIAYSINDACRASSLGRTTLYAHIAAVMMTVPRSLSFSSDAPCASMTACVIFARE